MEKSITETAYMRVGMGQKTTLGIYLKKCGHFISLKYAHYYFRGPRLVIKNLSDSEKSAKAVVFRNAMSFLEMTFFGGWLSYCVCFAEHKLIFRFAVKNLSVPEKTTKS